MAIFGPKPWVNLLGKMSIFRRFELVVFIAQKGVFSFQNIIKEIYLAYIAFKKKVEKWRSFQLNHGLTPVEKFQFFDCLNFLCLHLDRRFSVLAYHKRHFPELYCLKKTLWKMAIFGPKPWVKPFGKISIFRLFELVLFIAQKGVFSFQNIIKHIILDLYCLKKKKWKNGHFWIKPMG